MFLCDNTGNFDRLQYCNFEKHFLESKNLFKKQEYCFLVESTKRKTHHFRTKLSYQRPILTLKRPRVNLTPSPCGFSENASSREMVKPWLFVTFNIIISHIFSIKLFLPRKNYTQKPSFIRVKG